jgi:hypothetical protein
VIAAVGEIRRDDEPRRQQIASELADLPEEVRTWGWDKRDTSDMLKASN